MDDDFWTAFIDAIVSLRVASRSDIVGCSENQILAIELDQSVKLPEFYIEFLRVMGRSAGKLMRGSDFFYPELLGVKRAAFEIANDQRIDPPLPTDILVFFMHQGYMFAYVKVDGRDNPPVYFYSEGMAAVEIRWPSFQDFLWAILGHFR